MFNVSSLFFSVLFCNRSMVPVLNVKHIWIKWKLKDINPYPADILKYNNPPSIFDIVHYHFRDIKFCSPNSIEPSQTWLYTGGKD